MFKQIHIFLLSFNNSIIINWFNGDESWKDKGNKESGEYKANDKHVECLLIEDISESRQLMVDFFDEVNVTAAFCLHPRVSSFFF